MKKQSSSTAWLESIDLSTGSFLLPSGALIDQTLSIDARSGKHQLVYKFKLNHDDDLYVYVSQHTRPAFDLLRSILPTRDCETFSAFASDEIGLIALGKKDKSVHLRVDTTCEASLIDTLHGEGTPEIWIQSIGGVTFQSSDFPLKKSYKLLSEDISDDYMFLAVHSAVFRYCL